MGTTVLPKTAETGLDYFGARYYSPAQGRFTSVDPFNPITEFQPESDDEDAVQEDRERFDAYLAQPQHWNRYAYALNNPLAFIDEDGRVPVAVAAAAIAGARFLSSPQGQRFTQQVARYGQQLGNYTLTRGQAIANEVFALGPVVRGRIIEALSASPEAFRNVRTIDNFANGVATSIKSIDVFAKTYQNLSALSSTLSGYVQRLASYQGGSIPGAFVRSEQIQRRVLQVVMPGGNLSRDQLEVLRRIQEEAARQGVDILYYQAR
jgi:hypothetical protein